jgi:protein-S-isoprenylcysteine O-methyltransferase Ste14
VPLLAYAAAFWLAAHVLVLSYEERTLARRFGPGCTSYLRDRQSLAAAPYSAVG